MPRSFHTFTSASPEWQVVDGVGIIIESPTQVVQIELTDLDIPAIADILLQWCADNDVPMPCETVGHIDNIELLEAHRLLEERRQQMRDTVRNGIFGGEPA